TRIDKEDDRVRHIEALNAQTGPVFLTYRAVRELDDLFARKITSKPEIDFTASDKMRHTSWVLSDPADISFIESAFGRITPLYIADGHHRSAAAARIYLSRKGAGQSGRFLAVIFPHDQMQILPYNRVLKELNGLTVEALLHQLDSIFIIHDSGKPSPSRKHQLGFYLAGRWRTLQLRPQFTSAKDPVERLDVT